MFNIINSVYPNKINALIQEAYKERYNKRKKDSFENIFEKGQDGDNPQEVLQSHKRQLSL